MSEPVYRWKRFWYPRAERISLADGGYLYDPDEKYGKAYNPNLVSLDEILSFPCLILLGEAGIGKSKVLETGYERISNQIRSNGDEEYFLNLRSYGDESRLVRNLFESSKFRSWQAGSHKLHIFLDSFDECLLNIKKLAAILIDEFKIHKNQLHRLYLRIACRTGAWPAISEKDLQNLWSQNSIGIYELAPLRRVDVAEAANQKNLSADLFLEEVSRNDLVSLALNPLTLNFLLNTYSKNNRKLCYHEKVHELYRDGCEQLCIEVNRISHEYELESEQRLIIAARIAAVTIFTNRSSIWTSLDQGDMPSEDIKLTKLSYGYEIASSRKFEVTQKALRDVLETGLFSAYGPHQIGWAHKTYAEFLAAWYLVQHSLPLAQIKELIFISNECENRVVPQLHGTVAWLASMRLDVLQEVIKSDPDIVLKSDIPMDECLRKEIVGKLLLKYEKGELYSYSLVEINNYKKLKHPSLASQLRSYIQNTNQQVEARGLAIFIAKACDLSDLQEDLLNLALDSSQSIDLREEAVDCLSAIADDSTKLKLKPLATEFLPEDQQDQLKGYALHTLWPKLISSDELFKALTSPKSPNWHGSYWRFVDFHLVQEIQPCDLVIALNWLYQQGIRYLGHPFERVGDSFLKKAWENFEYPGMVESFIRVALLQHQEYQRVVSNREIEDEMASQLLSDFSKRRFLIQSAIPIMAELGVETYFLQTFLDKNILISEDIYWMLDNLEQSNSAKIQNLWSKMIERSFDRQDARQIDAILVKCQFNNILSKIFVDYFKSVAFNSDEEKNQRSTYQEYMECQKYQFKPKPLDPSPQDRIFQCLNQLESGEIDAWLQLNLEMTLRPDSKFYGSDFGLDLTALPGWQDSTENIRNRIVQGARYYIQHQQDSVSGWIGTDSYDRQSIAGCRALLLLLKQEPDFIQSLSSDIWKRWASVMVAMPGNDVYGSSYQVLVAHAYTHAPQECVDTFLIVLEQEIQKYDSILVIRLFDQCWDSSLELTILEKLKDPKLTPKLYGGLLKELIEKGSNEARKIARDILSLSVSLDQEQREKTLIVSAVLLRDCDPISWSLIWSLFQRDELFGREVIETATKRYFDGIQLNLTEMQLADFYIWLINQYPYEEKKETILMLIRPKDYINELRRKIIDQLINRGTQEACIAIQRLVQELPNLGWLKRVLVDTQANMRRKTWRPLELEHIKQLIASTEKRLIQDSNHLLDILLESLGRLESKLQGETSAVQDLWNEVDKKIYRPRSENGLSDYIKRFLEDDLRHRAIVVNREVEIRSNLGGNLGERTDIHVNAVLQNEDGTKIGSATVIIEVKGCWHKELFSAMQSQLVGRYLSDNPHAYGLYLVGWFNCQQWDSKDSRYQQSKKFNLDTVKARLHDQAQDLISENSRVRAFVLNAALR